MAKGGKEEMRVSMISSLSGRRAMVAFPSACGYVVERAGEQDHENLDDHDHFAGDGWRDSSSAPPW
jgi:hypothetical protein